MNNQTCFHKNIININSTHNNHSHSIVVDAETELIPTQTCTTTGELMEITVHPHIYSKWTKKEKIKPIQKEKFYKKFIKKTKY